MSCYLIDASALVVLLQKNPAADLAKAKQRMAKLIALKQGRIGPHLFIPNFCLTECSKALAGTFLDPRWSEDGEREYQQHKEMMLDFVSSSRRGLIQTYKLKRQHLVNIEDIFCADYRLTGRDERKRLSGLDGLIVAMARTLSRSYHRVTIVTNDKRLAKVCAANPDWKTQAVYIKEQEIPGT